MFCRSIRNAFHANSLQHARSEERSRLALNSVTSKKPMPRNIFRKVPQERLSSPEQLDQLMQVTAPRSWVALLTLVFLLAVAVVWGVYGTVPSKVFGQGILVTPEALTSIVSIAQGQILTFHVGVDDAVHKGQIVAELDQPDLRRQLADAESALALLYRERDLSMRYDGQVGELRTQNIAEQRKALQISITAQEERAKVLKSFAEHFKELLDKGFVTYKEYIDTQQDYDEVRDNINSLKARLTELSASKVDVDSQLTKERISLDERVLDAEDRVASMRERLERATKVVSTHSGRVVEMLKDKGQTIAPGEPLLILEEGAGKPGQSASANNTSSLAVIAYFSPYDGEKIQENMVIGVAPSVIKQEEYGFIVGTVTHVSDFPASPQGMLKTLRNAELVNRLSEGGAPVMVRAELQLDPSTPSGFRWSSGRGPSMNIHSGTLCDVNVKVRRQRPITLVIPFLEQTFMGVGDERLER